MSQHDDLFHELSRTLEVSPSPDFADGVRARITRRRTVLRTTITGLAIVASLTLVVVLRTPESGEMVAVERVASAPVVAAPNASAAPAVPAVPAVRSVPAAPREPAVTASHIPLIGPEPVQPDRLLVVTNQMAVLRAAWAGHQVTGAAAEAPPVEVVTTQEPPPIVVEPVRVLPVVIADQRTPINGLPIIRRAVAALEMK